MEKNLLRYLIFGVLLALSLQACKSEYEQIRTSGDPKKILEGALAYYEDEEYQRAQSLFELIISSYRGQKEAEEIYFKYAYTYFYTSSFVSAAYYFKNFTQTYSASSLREEAEFMSAYSNYKLSPKFRLDQTYTNTAIQELQLFVNSFPNSDRVQQCNDLIDEMRKAYFAVLLSRHALSYGQDTMMVHVVNKRSESDGESRQGITGNAESELMHLD